MSIAARLNHLEKMRAARRDENRRWWVISAVAERDNSHADPRFHAGAVDENVLRVPYEYAADPVAGLQPHQRALLHADDRVIVLTEVDLGDDSAVHSISDWPGERWSDLC